MTMCVTAPAMRPVNSSLFADIIGPNVAVESIRADGSALAVCFTAELTTEQADAVWWRMSSRDDAEEATRRSLAALIPTLEDPAATLEDVKAAVVEALRFAVGLPKAEEAAS